MKKNSGFTLIELVVSLAIMGIVGLVLFEFIAISSKTFRSVNTEVNLQYESQLTVNQLKDLIVDSNRGVVYGLQTVAGGFTEVDLTLPNAETVQVQNLETADAANVGTLKRCLLIYNQKTEGAVTEYPVIKIIWDPVTKKLMYAEKTFTDLAVLETDRYLNSLLETDYEVMSDYISSFSVIMSNEQDRIFDIKMDLNSSKSSYSSNASIALRNKVVISSDLNVIYTEVNIEKPNLINGVTIKKAGAVISSDTVSVGQTVNYEADVDVQIGATMGSEAVQWLLNGNSTYGAGTPTTLSQTGELKISDYELSTLLTVTAVSVTDSSKKAVINIVVENGRGEFGYVSALTLGNISYGTVATASAPDGPYAYYGVNFEDTDVYITYVNKDKIPEAERGVTWSVITDAPADSYTWSELPSGTNTYGLQTNCPIYIKAYYEAMGHVFEIRATTNASDYEGNKISYSKTFTVSGLQVPIAEVEPSVTVDISNADTGGTILLSRNDSQKVKVNVTNLNEVSIVSTLNSVSGFNNTDANKRSGNVYKVDGASSNEFFIFAKTQMSWNTDFTFNLNIKVTGKTNKGNARTIEINQLFKVPKVVMTVNNSAYHIKYSWNSATVNSSINYSYLAVGGSGQIDPGYYPDIATSNRILKYNIRSSSYYYTENISRYNLYIDDVNTVLTSTIMNRAYNYYLYYNRGNEISYNINATGDADNTLSQHIVYTFTN